MKSSNISIEPNPINTPNNNHDTNNITPDCFNHSETLKKKLFEISGRKFSNSSQTGYKIVAKHSPIVSNEKKPSLNILKTESIFKEQYFKQELATPNSFKHNCINLPKLSCIMRVNKSKDIVNDSKTNSLSKQPIFRRRLYSEEEESLIAFGNTKSNKKTHEMIHQKTKQPIKPSITKQEPNKLPDLQSRVIYDHSSIQQINKKNRKQSVDLGIRSRIRNSQIRNKSQGRNKNIISHLSNINLDSCFITQNKGNPFQTFFSQSKPITPNNELILQNKIIRKDSELIKENEQDATKGSSFNTELNCKNNNGMNNIFYHSDQNSQGTPKNKILNNNEMKELCQSSLPINKLCETKQKPYDVLENQNKRKGSMFFSRQMIINNDKSIQEGPVNQEEKIPSVAFINSIGSQFSDEIGIDLIEIEQEFQLELENQTKQSKKSFTQNLEFIYDRRFKSRSRNMALRKSAHLFIEELELEEKELSNPTGKNVVIHINFLIIRRK